MAPSWEAKMVWQNNLREIMKIIYHLKRRYGLSLSYYIPTSQTHDPRTGEISRSYDVFVLHRAVILPTSLERHFVYDLAYIAAAKNFTEGAYFDKNIKRIIIDKKDFPAGTIPDLRHHIEFDGTRYEIKAIQVFEDRRSYVFTVEGVINAPLVG